MADKTEKKSLKKRKGKKGQNEEEKLTKDETEVAKYLRWNLKTKKSMMYGDEVFYFTGSKIVDLMLDSKWASGKAKKSSIEFTDRDSTYYLLDKMIMLGLFSRVHRIYKEKEKKGKDKKDEKKKDKEKLEAKSSEAELTPKKEKKEDKKDGKDGKEGKKKKKVKVSLEPHELNIYVDSDDAVFIWIYDPVHPTSFFKGILLVFATIAVCLFPLWPESFRLYSWYLSVLAMVFIGVILFLAIFRYVIFGFIWGISIGKIHFWLLPNLTADCGFLESFVPLYEYSVPSSCAGKESKDKDGVKGENKGQENEKAEAEEAGSKLDKSTDNDKKEKNGSKDEKQAMEENGSHSGSNKDNDEGEPWVKVTKSDVENEPNVGSSDKVIC